MLQYLLQYLRSFFTKPEWVALDIEHPVTMADGSTVKGRVMRREAGGVIDFREMTHEEAEDDEWWISIR